MALKCETKPPKPLTVNAIANAPPNQAWYDPYGGGIQTGMTLHTEIERKFLVRSVPDGIEACERTDISQAYLAEDPDGTEVRLREVKGERWLTVKRGSGIVRQECDIGLTPRQFQALWPLTEGRRIEKVRIDIPVGDHVAELDIYAGALAGLLTVEVEFDTLEASRIFQPPLWFGAEITGDPRFLNNQLAQEGLPPDFTLLQTYRTGL